MGIASMIIGIIALVVSFVPFCGTWALIPAIVGLVLGAVDMAKKIKANQPRGMAISGVVMNILAIVVIFSWWGIAAIGTAAQQ